MHAMDSIKRPDKSFACVLKCRGADKSLDRPGRKQANVSVRMAWFPSAPCLQEKKYLMTARVWMLLKSCAFLTCFRACFLPGRDKDLSAPRINTDPPHPLPIPQTNTNGENGITIIQIIPCTKQSHWFISLLPAEYAVADWANQTAQKCKLKLCHITYCSSTQSTSYKSLQWLPAIEEIFLIPNRMKRISEHNLFIS